MVATADTLKDHLRGRGLRVTSQRLVLFAALADGGHLTAEQLFASGTRTLPGLSLPTVYATLDLLVDLGLVRRMDVGTGAAVYDARTRPHHHAVCRLCGALADLDVDVDVEEVRHTARSAGFHPLSTRVLVEGFCAHCAPSAG